VTFETRLLRPLDEEEAAAAQEAADRYAAFFGAQVRISWSVK